MFKEQKSGFFEQFAYIYNTPGLRIPFRNRACEIAGDQRDVPDALRAFCPLLAGGR